MFSAKHSQPLAPSPGTVNVVVSNYVVHELKSREDRERMMREVARILKPDGRVALVDFIFADDCVKGLASFGVDADRVRDGFVLDFRNS